METLTEKGMTHCQRPWNVVNLGALSEMRDEVVPECAGYPDCVQEVEYPVQITYEAFNVDSEGPIRTIRHQPKNRGDWSDSTDSERNSLMP